jgi:hypothetical protein
MRLPRQRLVALAAVSIAALAVAGCDLKFTGGGTIPSTDGVPADQANFGFNYKITNTISGAGNANGVYQDPFDLTYPLGGVEFKFTGLLHGDASPTANYCFLHGGGTGIGGVVNYTSQNSNYPGSGFFVLTACDAGQPAVTSGDWISVYVESGPYSVPSNYSNSGFLTGGNLKSHS